MLLYDTSTEVNVEVRTVWAVSLSHFAKVRSAVAADDVEDFVCWAHHVAVVVWQALAGLVLQDAPWFTINIALHLNSTATVVMMGSVAFWAPHLVSHDSWRKLTIIAVWWRAGVTGRLNAVILVAAAIVWIQVPAFSATHLANKLLLNADTAVSVQEESLITLKIVP